MIKKMLTHRNTHKIALIFLAIGLLILLVQKQSEENVEKVTDPLSTVVQSYDGQSWPLSRFSGKAMLVIFWGSFCPPCIEELPILSALARKYEQSVTFIGLAVESPAEEVAQMVRRFSLSYPIASVGFAELQRWGSHMLPSLFLLDAKGKIIWSHRGPASEELLENELTKVVS